MQDVLAMTLSWKHTAASYRDRVGDDVVAASYRDRLGGDIQGQSGGRSTGTEWGTIYRDRAKKFRSLYVKAILFFII